MNARPPLARGHPERTSSVGDSVLLGAFSVLVGIGALISFIASMSKPVNSWQEQLGDVLMFCTPFLGLINLYFANRDEKRGLRAQAWLGLILSALAVFVPIAPAFLGD